MTLSDNDRKKDRVCWNVHYNDMVAFLNTFSISSFLLTVTPSLIHTKGLICIWKKRVFGALSIDDAFLGKFFGVNSRHSCLSRHNHAIYCTVDTKGTLVFFVARWCNSSYCYRIKTGHFAPRWGGPPGPPLPLPRT